MDITMRNVEQMTDQRDEHKKLLEACGTFDRALWSASLAGIISACQRVAREEILDKVHAVSARLCRLTMYDLDKLENEADALFEAIADLPLDQCANIFRHNPKLPSVVKKAARDLLKALEPIILTEGN